MRTMMSLDRLMAVVAPHACLVCGSEGSLLCGYCQADVLSPVPSRCYRCHAQTQDFATCPKCRASSKVSNVWVRTGYDNLPKQLVHKLKFERAQGAAPVIAGLVAESLPYLPRDTIIIHIPTATSRRRQRGYDQSELIARELAKRTGLTFRSMLGRYGQSRQVGSSRKIRLQQLNEAFRPRHPEKIKGANILIVDDIVTTGATLETAALVLRQAGAKKLYATTFAQKIS